MYMYYAPGNVNSSDIFITLINSRQWILIWNIVLFTSIEMAEETT